MTKYIVEFTRCGKSSDPRSLAHVKTVVEGEHEGEAIQTAAATLFSSGFDRKCGFQRDLCRYSDASTRYGRIAFAYREGSSLLDCTYRVDFRQADEQ